MSMQQITNKLIAYAQLMRLHRPLPLWLMLWPVLWALWIAGDVNPPVWIVLVFISGVFVMRAAGGAINDIWDRELDKHVPRTKSRPLAAGTLTVKEAVSLVIVMLLIATALVLTLNLYTLLLAIAGLFGVFLYPFMKRITYYPQLVLGIVFNWGVLLAFTAITQHLPPIAWLILFTSFLWTVAYDTMYAMADREADVKIGIKSTAILLGDMDKLAIAVLQLLFLIGLGLIGWQLQMTIWFYFCLAAVLGLFIYEWWLIKDRDVDKCIAAFNHNNWVGIIIFLGIVLGLRVPLTF